ncbi:MAG: site-specific integrase [Gammaproteobacteria bacterium]|nr:site-specific integrase [Gammaproteobacteria bacterium]
MVTRKLKNNATPIKPLFLMVDDSKNIGDHIIAFAKDDYNKAIGASLIDAKNDAQAISSFLLEFRDAPLTLVSYSKEIERLLLWCIHIVKLNISSLRRDHLMAYQDFLKNPEPKNVWVGAKVKRQLADGSANPNWRPFGKALSATTINKVITILDSFFNYLVQTNYLTGNPLAVDRRRKKRNKTKPQLIDRYLEIDEIYSVLNALSNYAQKNNQETFQVVRARYIILLLFYTGLRIAEAANHVMGNFIQREENWFLRVIGKGKKLREIPVPDDLLSALADFRKSAGLPSPEPKFREKTPLIPMQNLKQSISTRRIDQILKWAFNLGAQQFDVKEPRRASKLRQASAHWLRHSYVTYLLDSGAPLKVVQENAGHSDVGTTMHYRHVAQTDRHEATRSLSLSDLKRKTRQSKCQD